MITLCTCDRGCQHCQVMITPYQQFVQRSHQRREGRPHRVFGHDVAGVQRVEHVAIDVVPQTGGQGSQDFLFGTQRLHGIQQPRGGEQKGETEMSV